ncbi:MAG: hypothetical protein DMG57_17845 [Acidobacteria bacterium]|nr:MAG: hypothetical protein DMG57_17845 [Acidobacteriota bacterium]
MAAAVFAYTGAWPEADHTFDTFSPSIQLSSPAQIVSTRPGRFIAVAASGGGIHAAGWTTRVIEGLYQELPVELRAPFAKSIGVISAVSGGSGGSLYVLNAHRIDDFRVGRFTNEQVNRYLFQPSVESTLDTMVQKLVFEDWWRILMPVCKFRPTAGVPPRKPGARL